MPDNGLEVSGAHEIELYEAGTDFFNEAAAAAKFQPAGGDWLRHGVLANGDIYLRWDPLLEFVISADGRRIAARKSRRTSVEAFQTYLLNQVLSFALIQHGIEPLHATAAVVDGQAVAWVAHSGQGKSTLASAFLQRGIPLLTDDLLVLREQDGGWWAVPGFPRIKLYPDVAKTLGEKQGRGIRMNPFTQKLVIPLRNPQFVQAAVPLRALYVLDSGKRPGPGQAVRIRKLPAQKAFLAVTEHTFNTRVVEPQRLKRQFHLATRLASCLPIRSIRYVRNLVAVPKVRDAILSDLERIGSSGKPVPA